MGPMRDSTNSVVKDMTPAVMVKVCGGEFGGTRSILTLGLRLMCSRQAKFLCLSQRGEQDRISRQWISDATFTVNREMRLVI